MKKLYILILLGILLSGCGSTWEKVANGVVLDVQYKTTAGDFWNNPKKYTIVLFEDERQVVFNNLVPTIWLNKCNQFLKNSFNNQIKAELCEGK